MTDSSGASSSSDFISRENEETVDRLFSHWVKKKSSSKAPGQFYYFNTKTKASVWSLEDLVKEEKLFEKQKKQIVECLQKKNIRSKVENGSSRKSITKKHSSSAVSTTGKKRKNTESSSKDSFYTPSKKKSKSPIQHTKRKPASSEEPGKESFSPGLEGIHEPKSVNKTEPFLPGPENDFKREKKTRCFEPISYFGIGAFSNHNDDACASPMEDDEHMEVDDVDPGILEELRHLRRSDASSSNSLSEQFHLAPPPSLSSEQSSNLSSIVVIDTNIFISHLSSIHKILELGHRVHVPWTVLRELDLLKDSRRGVREAPPETMSFKARRAIDFLHKSLSSEDSRVFGQNPEEEREASLLFRGSCPDDTILQCVLYLKKQKASSPTTFLLYSNDKNLLNKAILSGVSGASSSSLLSALKKNLKNRAEDMTTTRTALRALKPSSSPLISVPSTTPYDLKKDIIDEAKDLSLQLLTNSLKSEMILAHGSIAKIGGSSSMSSWSLNEAFRQLFLHWESLYSPLLKGREESSQFKKELGVVESLLARPRPLNKVWNLMEECLGSLNLFNSAICSSRPAYYASCGRNVQIRIEMLLKRKSGVEKCEQVEFSSGGGNIYESFNSIWNYVYAYVTSYSVSCGMPLSSSIPPPKEVAFVFNEISTEEISHINALTNESKKLAKKLNEFLGVSGEELSTSSPILLDLIDTMHKFITYCSSFRPGGHPSADPLPKLVPRSLLHYSTQNETRQRMVNGLYQLQDLIRQLELCCAKF